MKFYSSIAELYDFIFPLKPAQVEFVKDALKSGHSGARGTDNTGAETGIAEMMNILDIGCGTGSLAYALTAGGFRATAIDFDKRMIEKAVGKTGDAISSDASNPDTVMPKFRQMDMLKIDEEFARKEFDAVLCFGNTLVHLQDSADIFDFIHKAWFILKTNGMLMMQIINYDHILDNELTGLPVIENDRIRFERYYSFNSDSGLMHFKTNLMDKSTGRLTGNEVLLYPIRKADLMKMISKAGFSDIILFGSFTGEPYSSESIPLIVKAVK